MELLWPLHKSETQVSNFFLFHLSYANGFHPQGYRIVAATLAIKYEFQAEWSQGAGDKGAKRPSQKYHPMKSADISSTTLNCTRIWGNTDSVSKDKGQNGYWVDNLGVSASPNHVTNLAFVLIFSLFMYQNRSPHLLAIGRQHVSQWRVCTWVRLSVFWS